MDVGKNGKRHAYLIMAYHQWELLEKLVGLLDDKRNDIFIHVDKKSKNVPFDEIKKAAMLSGIFFVDRLPVRRFTYDLYEVTIALLRAAVTQGEYGYLHLITGQDLPIKNQDYIHDFFERNDGKNFVDVVPMEKMREHWRERISLYHFFSPCLTPTAKGYGLVKMADRASLAIQKKLRVNRIRRLEIKGWQLRYGSAWFSITKEFAEFLLANEAKTQKIFKKWTYIPEEAILQSLVWNDRFRDTLFDADFIDHDLNRANLRMIFWSGKTSPETITMEHVKELGNTPNLFARKFDLLKHRDAVEAVERMVKEYGMADIGGI